jgi:hypothetical protein
MATNPKDPLLNSGPNNQRELFNQFCQLANGFSAEEVVGAAANLLVNAIRQAHATRAGALASYDETTARVKGLLASHYDVLGRRRNVFAFHQVIELGHHVDTDFGKRS